MSMIETEGRRVNYCEMVAVEDFPLKIRSFP